ncbi:MAG: ubiquinol oxidase subunit II [Paracoccus sp. (in: a-proteobacteria)]|nr:ubiquinol oxidase subunit II [Paracoccus sp. (in: a-proteobacteria)]
MMRHFLAAGAALVLAGCGSEVLAPSGDVAVKTRDVLAITTALILVIVLPVMVAIVWFAIRYRAGSKQAEAEYDPSFHHSVQLELLIWAAPLTIIIWLGALTWVSTHKLDPYRPLDSETRGVSDDAVPLVVQVVSMDWKWLFIYPEYGIATVNELAAPLNRPIRFELTATEVMTAFYVPTLAGMIYTMPGMQTQLHAVINEPGQYKGMASHYSGAGFSGMNFPFFGMEDGDFDAWVARARASGQVLDRATYRILAEPSQNVPPARYALGDPGLYHAILNRCLEPGQICMDEMMAADHAKRGGGGHGAAHGAPAHGDHGAQATPAADGHGGHGAGTETEPEAPHWGMGGAHDDADHAAPAEAPHWGLGSPDHDHAPDAAPLPGMTHSAHTAPAN